MIGRVLVLLALALPALAPRAQPADCPPAPQPPTAAQLQAALAGARDRGALWRITRDGRDAYLYATLHVGTLEWAMPGPRVSAALMASDTLALELDPLDATLMARLRLPSDAARPSSAALAERLARRVERACVPAAARPAIEALHPVMQAVTLVVLEAAREGLDAQYGQEVALAGLARAAQRRVVSLETPEQQLAALLPTSAHEAERLVAGTLDQLDSGTTRRTVARLAQAWARGDLETLADYERWCECALEPADHALLQRLLDDRNPGLAARIDLLHREGRRVFAGVGALHLVGPAGLPALLAARGYRVERIAF